MRNLLLTLCYDGSAYHGWQVQRNAVSVQQVFQQALEKVTGTRPDVKGCSRTDTGVHARRFCCSFHTEHTIPPERLVAALNHFLPRDVSVLACREVPADFHARYSCRGKEYEYQIWNHPVRNPFLRDRALHYYYSLDLDRLNAAAGAFIGRHNFTSFCSADARVKGDLSRTITCSQWRREGDLVVYRVSADGFLYNMVRILVGTQLWVAAGKLAASDMHGILSAEDRNAAGPTAPAAGLYLNRVFYDSEDVNQ